MYLYDLSEHAQVVLEALLAHLVSLAELITELKPTVSRSSSQIQPH